jgi:diguanylate cyclase (GGDEF)-like protein
VWYITPNTYLELIVQKERNKLLKNEFKKTRFSKKEIAVSLVILTVTTIILGCIFKRQFDTNIQSKRLKTALLASAHAYDIQCTIEHTLSVTYAVSELIQAENGHINDFSAVVNRLTGYYNGISCVQLAPDGIVTQIEPLAGNEAALGHNLFHDPERAQEAYAARDSGILSLAGPYDLKQGYNGFIGRLPVFIKTNRSDNDFWGFVNVVISTKEIVDALNLSDLQKQGYNFTLSKIMLGTNRQIVVASSERTVKDPVEYDFTVANTNWIFCIEPEAGWINTGDTVFFSTLLIILDLSIFFSSLLLQDFFVYNKKLEQAVSFDSLTGVYTKQAGLLLLKHEIKKAVRNSTKITVCFVDMDNFKYINDTYGHRAGDKLLIRAADLMTSSIRQTDIITRFGGDEFLIAICDYENQDQTDRIVKRIRDVLHSSIQLGNNVSVDFSASIGTSVYPSDGMTSMQLIEHADKEMYCNKKCNKKNR